MENKNIYFYEYNGGKGILEKRSDKWFILKGTRFALKPTDGFINKHGPNSNRNLMEKRNKILDIYCINNVLQEDYPINSPSLAGALIGYNISEVKRRWTNSKGISLSDIERKLKK